MSRSMRCAWVIGLGIGLLTFSQTGSTQAQKGDQGGRNPGGAQDRRDDRAGADSTPSAWAVSVPTDAALAKQLEAARDYIKQEAWVEATYVLQALLDTKEDVFVGVRRGGADSKEMLGWTGLRIEADRLLANLPVRGRELYETARGPEARILLTQATHQGNPSLLAEVTQRYFHTAAGAEATGLLGVHFLDRGRSALAALCFERLLERLGVDGLPPATLVPAIVAFRLAGNEARAEQVWKRLRARHPGGVRVGDRLVTLAELETELSQFQVSTSAGSSLRFGAGLVRDAVSPSAPAIGSASLLETEWMRPTAHEGVTRQWVQTALRREEDRSDLVLAGSSPVVAGDKVIYRSYGGIQAVARQTGAPAWEAGSEWSLDRMVRQMRYHNYLASWVGGYMANNPHLLFENSTLGTLGTDGSRVYAVEDLPLPPYPISYTSFGRRRGPVFELSFGPDLTDPAHHNRLLALDADSGKVVWEIGGRGPTADREWDDSYFLGPPLPVDGRLFAVVEKNQELRLVCLDAAQGTLLWKQALAVPLNRLLSDVGRRVEALLPAHASGLLVCPTNVGVVLGVDLFHRSLAWAYVYREEALSQDADTFGWGRRGGRYTPRELPRVRQDWKASAPVIYGNKVVLTAADTAALHCLDLHTGARLWKVGRKEDDLYLAGVHNGKVLLVGKQNCRAVNLSDGKPLWTVETGLPSGRGVASGSVYYLPLKSALPEGVLQAFGASLVGVLGSPWGRGPALAVTALIPGRMPEKRPAVCAIDLDKGVIRKRIPAPRGNMPGNLVLCDDAVLSQTALAVTAYSQPKRDKEPGK